ncbi:chorismate--pyruvate lyase family protein [Legionella brunensis]|uniref:4-hydroxybenzoate synthetase n=1 Tax=Legionella brunensis TaxID=29422 RepID=A0A0W0S490_9GAMM|nr:chorismate lyase [Legionella brunensis]KTC78316.1 4-hydroxybenzoate synthetase [Legionella brunensis]
MFNQIESLATKTDSPPAVLLPWLTHELSLTDKLKDECGEASLSVLNQRWEQPNWWDKFVLGLSGKKVIHREIIMSACDTPCWYARTIIPDHCYQANPPFYDRLQKESLGVIVFNTPAVKRNQMIHYPINVSCLEYHWFPSVLTEENSRLWVRLSIFSLAHNATFHLVEILLPGLLRIIK